MTDTVGRHATGSGPSRGGWTGQARREAAVADKAYRLLSTLAAMAAVASIFAMAPYSVGTANAQRVLQVTAAKRTATVLVPVGKTEDVRVDASFTDITVGDPEVADVTPLTDRAISILGKKIGTTRVTVYAEGKRQLGIFDIEVSYDVSRLATELARVAGRSIKVSSIRA